MDNIEKKVKEIVADQLGVSLEQVTNESSFIADLGGDSLDTVEMVLALEDEYGIDVPEEIAENLDTVQKVLDYLSTLDLSSNC